MLLSDGELREAINGGDLIVTPFDVDSDNLQSASIDLRLDPIIQVQRRASVPGMTLHPDDINVTEHLDLYAEEVVDLSQGQSWEFAPGRFVIGQTLETIGLPLNMAGRVEGRSRLARLGVGVHITAPKIDPGFHNRITLEIFNLGPWTISLRAEMKICTLLVERLGRPAQMGYDGMFQGR